MLLDRPGLIEVESATRVYQEGRTIDMVQPFFSVDFNRPGIDAILSPGGNYAVTRRRPRATGRRPSSRSLYDVRSGKSLPTGFGRGRLRHRRDLRRQPLGRLPGHLRGRHRRAATPLVVLRTCELGAARCSDVVPLATDEGMPILGS